jgi:hypothetical protein
MVSGEKKTKTNPEPKNELPSKDKSPSGVDTSNASKDKSTSDAGTSKAAEGGKNADPVSYSRGEGQNRFLRLTEITGTRFSGKRRNDNSASPLLPSYTSGR